MKQIEAKKERTISSNYGFFGLGICGLIHFLVTQDFTMMAGCFILASVFAPYDSLPYQKWTKSQKGLVLGQYAVFLICLGLHVLR